MTKEFAFGSSIIDEGMAVKVKRVYAKPVKADGPAHFGGPLVATGTFKRCGNGG
jgi:hypothetical protein